MSRLRRNQIVLPTKNDGYVMYGRIINVLPNNKYRVIDCGKHVTIYHHDDIHADGYKGHYKWRRREDDPERFLYMSTLRRLKQYSQCYNPDIWKKPKYRVLGKKDIDFDLAHDAFWGVTDGDVLPLNHSRCRAIKDHNVYKRWIMHGVIATMYRAERKARRLSGHNWEILISHDYREEVEILRGKREDIINDLVLLQLSKL